MLVPGHGTLCVSRCPPEAFFQRVILLHYLQLNYRFEQSDGNFQLHRPDREPSQMCCWLVCVVRWGARLISGPLPGRQKDSPVWDQKSFPSERIEQKNLKSLFKPATPSVSGAAGCVRVHLGAEIPIFQSLCSWRLASCFPRLTEHRLAV